MQETITNPFCGQLPYVFLIKANFQISDDNHQLCKHILKTQNETITTVSEAGNNCNKCSLS